MFVMVAYLQCTCVAGQDLNGITHGMWLFIRKVTSNLERTAGQLSLTLRMRRCRHLNSFLPFLVFSLFLPPPSPEGKKMAGTCIIKFFH